jgi:predicted esterase
VVLVGFSNGGAFAVLLALHGLVRGCAFASMHGFPAGALHAEAEQHSPILLIGGTGAAWESAQMSTTAERLNGLAWPHEAKTHDEPHAISDADLEDVVDFAQRAVRSGCSEPSGQSERR